MISGYVQDINNEFMHVFIQIYLIDLEYELFGVFWLKKAFNSLRWCFDTQESEETEQQGQGMTLTPSFVCVCLKGVHLPETEVVEFTCVVNCFV